MFETLIYFDFQTLKMNRYSSFNLITLHVLIRFMLAFELFIPFDILTSMLVENRIWYIKKI